MKPRDLTVSRLFVACGFLMFINECKEYSYKASHYNSIYEYFDG